MFKEQFKREYEDLSLALRTNGQAYVLIDPVTRDPLLGRHCTGQITRVPVAHGDLRSELRPYLLALGEVGRDATFDELFCMAVAEARRIDRGHVGRSICGWIATQLPVKEVALELARHSKVYVDGVQRLFRLWDPRTLDLLHQTLSEQQVAGCSISGANWYWLSRNVELRSLSPSGKRNGSLPLSDLESDQISALKFSAVYHAVIDILQDMGRYPGGEDLDKLIIRAIKRAHFQWRVPVGVDMIDFALYAGLVHEHFDKDHEVHQVMDSAIKGGHPATRALTNFSDDDWAAVQKRLVAI